MPEARFIYLDNAATSLPKPACVGEAMARYARECGAPARGTHRRAVEAAREVDACREAIVRLVSEDGADGGGPRPVIPREQVVFTLNCSDALNLAIKGLILHRVRTAPHHPVHVIASSLDHNSILRPLHALEGSWLAPAGLRVTLLEPDARSGQVRPEALERAIAPDTLLFATLHASNVTGVIQPVEALGAVCARHGVKFVLDAAQSLGHVGLDMQRARVDLLALAGHKGLLGPTGTGALVIAPGVEEELEPLREGGTGSRIELDRQPTVLPDKYEAGSHNTMGILGLGAGVGWLLERGVHTLRTHERALTARLIEGLASIPGVRVLGPLDPSARVGTVSLVQDRLAPVELSRVLEERHGVISRSGLHCAPLAHRGLGTTADAARLGATRFSLGPFNTTADVDAAVEGVRESLRAPRPESVRERPARAGA